MTTEAATELPLKIVISWCRERQENSRRLMETKFGLDRRGWKDDLDYWIRIVSELDAIDQRLAAPCAALEAAEEVIEGYGSKWLLNNDDAVSNVAEIIAKHLPAPASRDGHEWCCFFCGEIFTDHDTAAIHFGGEPFDDPACVLKDRDDISLVEQIREAQAQGERHRKAYWALYAKVLTELPSFRAPEFPSPTSPPADLAVAPS